MTDHHSDSLFVPEESPLSVARCVMLSTLSGLADPVSDDGVDAIKSAQAFEADQSQHPTAADSPEKVYDPTKEPLPSHPYFDLDVPTLHSEIDASLRDLWISLQGFEEDDAEMENQREVIQRGRVVGAPKPLVVTTVGPAGVGKSFLYKALFNRPNITKSSAEGRSCTLYPTKIMFLPKAAGDATISDVDIEFFDAATIATMAENHIRRYHDYHFDPDSDLADDDSRRYAFTAEEFLNVAFDVNGNAEATMRLQHLLTADRISNGDLLHACIDAIERRVSSLGTAQDRNLSFLHVEDDNIDQVRSIADALAPFVDFIVIKTDAPLLNAGLTFIDLPGKLVADVDLTCADFSRPT